MKFPLIATLIFLMLTGYAQTDSIKTKKKQFPALSANYAYGNILPTNDFVEGKNLLGKPLEHYQSYTLKATWQNPGYTDWQRVYRCPYYGLGLTVGDFFDPDEVGYPVSLYGVFGIPIKRWDRFEINSEFQFGIAWN